MQHSFSWDQYFMTMAYLISMKSKDPSTRVGAVIVGPDHEIRSTGYNGLPRGLEDHKYRYEDRDYKLKVVNHAEENAILNCSLMGVSAKGCTLYCPWLSCSHCAKMIIQTGIKRVVIDINHPGNNPNIASKEWQESMEIAKEMFTETGVTVVEYKGPIIKFQGLFRGEEYPVEFISHSHVA